MHARGNNWSSVMENYIFHQMKMFFYHCTNKTIHYMQVLFDTTMDQCIEWITEPIAKQKHMDAAELHLWRSKLI